MIFQLKIYQSLLILLIICCSWNDIAECIIRRRYTRQIGRGSTIDANAILSGDKIDLESIEGVEQVTRLMLIKTDSLPAGQEERINSRYLNSLMETLYTGLRKPFKSVSADILGIFPSFEEIQVQCVEPSLPLEDKVRRIRRRRFNNDVTKTPLLNETQTEKTSDDVRGLSEVDSKEVPYKTSSSQVCQAITSDCLSIEDLIQILPPGIKTFDKALVRLCPIMLFRIMNHLCDESNQNYRLRDRPMLAKMMQAERDDLKQGENTIALNNLIREIKHSKNLKNSEDLSSKKPQKLHKKLKTQSPYKINPLNANGVHKHGSVDEQLLKIRLKLTEPSIEKVWIFSLLFVILSIVVSMGGLIVLPFVKKTTRRRILTLFEGLAVGGLAGSATLHMFPQAFGLVDENYHKYFWRIFVVFFGIYLCYLCERIIKIVKVMRSKMRRRSYASLVDRDICYGLPSIVRGLSGRNTSSRALNSSYDCESNIPSHSSRKRSSQKHSGSRDFSNQDDYLRGKTSQVGDVGGIVNTHKQSKKKVRTASDKFKREIIGGMMRFKGSRDPSKLDVSDVEPISIDADQSQARERLVHCLKSVQSQFSPVYAVQSQQNVDGTTPLDEPRAGRLIRLSSYKLDNKRRKVRREEKLSADSSKKGKIQGSHSLFDRTQQYEQKPSQKKYQKQRDVETRLYHQRLTRPGMTQIDRANLNRGYLQHRLKSVNNMAAERQDQDNAARMSVDTVAWMIVFGDAVLNVIDGLSIGAAFERNILAGISISVAVMLEEVTHRLGTFAVLIRAGMSMQQSLLCTFISACALFPGLIVGILLSDATEDATPYIFCAAGGIFLYMALVDVMKEMNRSIENAIRKDIKSTLQIFALQNVGIILAVIFLSFLALYEQAMDFEEYQIQYNQAS